MGGFAARMNAFYFRFALIAATFARAASLRLYGSIDGNAKYDRKTDIGDEVAEERISILVEKILRGGGPICGIERSGSRKILATTLSENVDNDRVDARVGESGGVSRGENVAERNLTNQLKNESPAESQTPMINDSDHAKLYDAGEDEFSTKSNAETFPTVPIATDEPVQDIHRENEEPTDEYNSEVSTVTPTFITSTENEVKETDENFAEPSMEIVNRMFDDFQTTAEKSPEREEGVSRIATDDDSNNETADSEKLPNHSSQSMENNHEARDETRNESRTFERSRKELKEFEVANLLGVDEKFLFHGVPLREAASQSEPLPRQRISCRRASKDSSNEDVRGERDDYRGNEGKSYERRRVARSREVVPPAARGGRDSADNAVRRSPGYSGGRMRGTVETTVGGERVKWFLK